jgi:hypothetical protein
MPKEAIQHRMSDFDRDIRIQCERLVPPPDEYLISEWTVWVGDRLIHWTDLRGDAIERGTQLAWRWRRPVWLSDNGCDYILVILSLS